MDALSAAPHERQVPKPRRRSVTGPLPALSPADSGARSGRLLRPLLTVTIVASVVHLGFALSLLLLLDMGEALLARARPIAVFVVGLTTALSLASSLRTSASEANTPSLDRLVRTAPAVFGLMPPIASVLALVVTVFGRGLGVEQGLQLTVAVLAATSAPGLLVALGLEQIGSTFAARGRLGVAASPSGAARDPDPDPGSSAIYIQGSIQGGAFRRRGDAALSGVRSEAQDGANTFAPPSLARRLVRQSIGLLVASGLLMLAHSLLHGGELLEWFVSPRALLAGLASAVTVALIVLSAASAGRSPGRDVRALAHRLDAIGWNDARSARRPLAGPVRLTSFDAVGELFRNLEQLRARLAEDVSTYQRALDRTHDADQAKGEFLAAVSHELRTPLNSIMGFAQLLLETKLNDSQVEDVKLILAGGRQLHELIADILDLSMIESGELDLRVQHCALDELVAELVDIHQAQVRDRELELVADVADDLPTIECDRRRIGQVLTNLMSNAIKFTEAGSVTVRARLEQDDYVSVAVIDTGIGIAESELPGVFEEYRQAGERKRKAKGTGLGLAIARRIVQAHGGRLEAESTLGEGSTFRLTLPLDASEHVSAHASRSAMALAVVRAYKKDRRLRDEDRRLTESEADRRKVDAGPPTSGQERRGQGERRRAKPDRRRPPEPLDDGGAW